MADRDPCPIRIVSDTGGAFSMGFIGGYGFHLIRGYIKMGDLPRPKTAGYQPGWFVKGFTNMLPMSNVIFQNPVYTNFIHNMRMKRQYMPGINRFRAGKKAAFKHSARLGAGFAAWGGVYSTVDCTLVAIRRKDDYKNGIASGFVTGGVLAARAGRYVALQSAIVGGVLLAAIEGVMHLVQLYFERRANLQLLPPVEEVVPQKKKESKWMDALMGNNDVPKETKMDNTKEQKFVETGFEHWQSDFQKEDTSIFANDETSFSTEETTSQSSSDLPPFPSSKSRY